jgi:Flp pilus assembly protein TadG
VVREHKSTTSPLESRGGSGFVGRIGDERGVALTEFALILPLLMLVLIGMLDFGKAYNYWIDQTHLANEGARWAAVDKNPAGVTMTLQQYIASKANTDELKTGGTSSITGPLGVCIAFPAGTSNVGNPVEVRVSTTYNWLPMIGAKISILQTEINGKATMRIEKKPVNYGSGAGGTPATC